MTKPQQPDIRRSERSPVDQDSAKAKIVDQPHQERPHGADKGDKGGGEGDGVPPDQQSPYPD